MNDLIIRTIDYLERRNAESVSKAPSDTPGGRDIIFVGSEFFMGKFTRIIEEEILRDKLSNGQLFVNFQSLAKFLRRATVYEKLAGLGNSVTVYGAGDAKLPANPFYVPMVLKKGDSLLGCWFIVYSSANKYYALVAMEKKLKSKDLQGRTRRFRGFWTNKRSIVAYVIDYLTRVVNVQYSRLEGD